MKAAFYRIQWQKGVTLIELMIAVVVLAILAALAVPSFQGLIERKNLQGAAEKLFADMQFAKSEAIKRNQPVYISFDETAGSQCYGLSLGAACACNTADSCMIDVERVVNMTEFPNVILGASFASTSFNPRRGTAFGGHVDFTNNYAVRVVLSGLGKITLCVPNPPPPGTTALSIYSACP